MLRYKVTSNGVTTIEACCVREFFGPDSPAPPGAQILEIFDPDDPKCKYNDDYIYTYPDEGEPQYIDLVYATVMAPNNKGGNLFRIKKVISSKLRKRISSAVLQMIEEEKKEGCAAKSEIDSLQPVSPSKINRKKLVLPPDVENQINSLVCSIMEELFPTTKQPGNNQVGTQQATTSKQSVVSQSNPNR